jgi:uncharacterized protein
MKYFRSTISAIGLVLLSHAFINPAYAINCRKAKTQIDHAICANPELLQVDFRLNRVYRSVLRSVGGKNSILGRRLKSNQQFWNEQRNFSWQNPEGECYRNDACLIWMHEARIAELEGSR